jgi:enterochelin esterase-like enzyme
MRHRTERRALEGVRAAADAVPPMDTAPYSRRMNLDIRVPPWARSYISDHTAMHRAPHPVDATKVSRFSLDLPDDVYFEYAFIDESSTVRADPEREASRENPWYPEVTAVRGPTHGHHPLADPPEPVRAGEYHRHRLESRAFGASRRLVVYRPRDVPERPPVLVFADGIAYMRIARAPAVYEALRQAGEVDAALLAFAEPADREREYAFDDRHTRFVLDELLPFLRLRYDTGDETVLAGASLGGLAAARTALAADGDVATVLTQSGAFLGTPEDARFHGSDESWLEGELRRRERLSFRWASDVGTIEWLTDVNRRVHERLERIASEHAYAERSAGHNWRNWRDGLPALLRFALRPGR